MLVIFDMLVSLFERPYLVAHQPQMSPESPQRRNSKDDSLREWCRRGDFALVLSQSLRGEDPEFQQYLERMLVVARGGRFPTDGKQAACAGSRRSAPWGVPS